ncbi:MAG TPA: malonyl-CoA decarboxylase [Trueperaceae bacterium]
MEIETQARVPRPFLNRALTSIRSVWRELAFGRNSTSRAIRPDLPDPDLGKLRNLMIDCIEEQGIETAARAEAAKLGYLYLTLSEVGRKRFLRLLTEEFGLDPRLVSTAVEAYLHEPGSESYARLQEALRPPRVHLLKMFNSLPEGFKFLVDLRADLLSFLKEDASLRELDHDLKSLFEAWFDVGLLTFEDISWDSPASLLEKLVAYEAVHAIRSWDDLKNRLDEDRRCYAFFHPKIPNEPLIFVEVALTKGIPSRIHDLLDLAAPVIDPHKANTAVFYSISSTQQGLRGISFGNFLLKQVTDRLARQHPGLRTFVTLSPIPGFRRWLLAALAEGRAEELLDEEGRVGRLHAAVSGAESLSELLEGNDWYQDETISAALEEPLMRLCTHYLLHERNQVGKPRDPVERFHIFNGAKVERLNWLADTSEKGLAESFGMMVNYLYEIDRLEENYELFFAGEVAASNAILKLDRSDRREGVAKE